MNFFNQIHETQITRRARQPRAAGKAKARGFVPLHRRLFPIDQTQRATARAVARAAVREVLG
ncbi:MAG TPA: hypothetical protein VM662_02680 [Sphingomonas sp.]|nr:hypothetical protein [Sphingomonas sp.]